jgi:protein gp37
MGITYNCWHGCHKKSEGCLHCYVYRRDESIGVDSNIVYKTKSFDLPIRKDRNGNYKYPRGTKFDLCFSSDFFIEEADEWRMDVLEMIRERSDCEFFCITKRPERIMTCIPDIGAYRNLTVYCTMENQKRFDERAPLYLDLPLKRKGVMMEPMLERIDFSGYYDRIDIVAIGGESGEDARLLDFEWVKEIRKQCLEHGIDFYFHQTGARIKVNGKIYEIPRSKQHSQARKAFRDQY